jgi:chromosome segregation ATPase
MRVHIQSFQMANQQIEMFKSLITEVQNQILQEDKKRKSQIDKRKSQIETLQNDLTHPKITAKLVKLQTKLRDAVNQSVTLDEQIVALTKQNLISEPQQEKLDLMIENLQNCIDKWKSTTERIGSFGSISISISEKESLLLILEHSRKFLSSQIAERELTAKSLLQSIESNQQELIQSEQHFETFSNSSEDLNLNEFENQLSIEKVRLNELSLILTEAETEEQSEINQTRLIITEEELINQNFVKQIEQLESEITDLEEQKEQRKIENDILLNKKVSLIEQLQKSHKEKVAEITRARSNSPYVRRLIEQQQQNWIERQKLFERFGEVAEEHEATTRIVARKAVIAKEMAVCLRGIPKGSDALTSLNAAYKATQMENKRLAMELQTLQKELEMIQCENNDVKQQLAQLHE